MTLFDVFCKILKEYFSKIFAFLRIPTMLSMALESRARARYIL